MTGDTLDWLLEPDQPSVRYFTLTDLLDKPANNREVREAREEIMKTGPVAKILSMQQTDGGFMTPAMVKNYGESVALTGYQPKKNTTWQLLTLAQLGVDSEDARIKKLCKFVLEHNYSSERRVFGMNIIWQSDLEFRPLPCFVANMIWALSTLGYYEDSRVQDSLQWLLKYQRFDDGDFKTPDEWPYRGKKDRCYGKHTCYSSCTRALKAMTVIPPAERSPEVKAFTNRAIDFVLLHRLYRKSHGVDRPIRAEFAIPAFPTLHYDDVIGMVEMMQFYKISHPSVDEALQFIAGKRKENGRWNMGYTMNRSSVHYYFGDRGEPSKWITLRALRVLKRAGFELP